MDYGVFNLDSGNLIDSFDSETDALKLIASLIDQGIDPESIGLVLADAHGRTVRSLHGRTLTDAVYAGGSGTPIPA